jgi:endonuclease-3
MARTSPAERARVMAERLEREYPDAHCALAHRNPLELLVATILSAQCTDARVNQVTPPLFARWRDARAFAAADPAELQTMVRSTGFFRNKAKAIRGACARIEEAYAGRVPRTMEELLTLPGVARKTANVVLGTAYGIPSGVVVDTHVQRLARRMGLTRERTPEKIERDLMAALPIEQWVPFAHRMIHHGRRVCTARAPRCAVCRLADACPRIGVVEAGRGARGKGAAAAGKGSSRGRRTV